MGDLSQQARSILSGALSDRSRALYRHYLQRYVQFCDEHRISSKLPISIANMLNFLAYLIYKGYKVNTVAGHSSALGYISKLYGFQNLNDSFLLKQFFKGASKVPSAVVNPDSRVPITFSVLQKLLAAIPKVILCPYKRVLFAAMCIIAFHGFLRIGELCVKNSKPTNHVLRFQDVSLVENNGLNIGVEILLQSFKHSKHPVKLFLPADKHGSIACPVAVTKLYLSQARHTSGPFFQLKMEVELRTVFLMSFLKVWSFLLV